MREIFETTNTDPDGAASIEKLQILGVRSFDHRGSGQRIEFKAPLTLIVGYNGSGKTTIIESLKYAATGSLPPNAKKEGAFVHDPKLAVEPEVLAQVRLQFKNALGYRIVVTRSLSCTVKKGGKYSQHTLESNLTIDNDGERTNLSNKNMQMDQAVPFYMGVSAAILENVIFCHQEDSLWPMSEPGLLKRKFDEIFEAQKYTKAIESLYKMKKKHADALKLFINEEKHSKENNNKAKRMQKKITNLSDAIDIKKEQIRGLERAMAETDELAAEKHRLATDAHGIVGALENKKQQETNIEYTLETLRNTLQDRDEPTAVLESMLAEYDESMRHNQQRADGYLQQYKEIQDSEATSRRQLGEKQREKGQHAAQKENHEANLRNRAELIRDSARVHSIRGYDGDLDDDTIKEFLDQVDRSLAKKEKEVSNIKADTAKDVRQHQESITDISDRKASRLQEKVTAKQQIKANDKAIQSKQAEMNSIRMDEGTRAALETSHRETEENLEKAKSAYQAADWDTKLSAEKKVLLELEGQLARLGQELMQRTKTMKDTAALDLAKKEAQQAQRSLTTMVSTYSEQLNKVVGNWTPESLQRDYQVVLDQVERSLADAKAQQEGANRDEHDNSFRLKTLKADLAKKNAEMESCKNALLGSIVLEDDKPITSIDEYLRELKSLEAERDETQKILDSRSYVSDYYKKSLTVVNTKNCCNLCDRAFANTNEKRSATDKINKLLEKYVKGELEQELKLITDDLEKAQKVRPQYDIWKRLFEVDIPALEKEIQKMEDKSRSLISSCEKQDEIVSSQESNKRDVAALATTVNDITKYCAEILKQEDRITQLSSQQKLVGSSLSLEEIEDKQEVCSDQIKAAKGKVDKISAERETAKTEINDLEREAGRILNKLNSAQHLMEKKQLLSDSISNLNDLSTKQRQVIKDADESLEKLEPDLAKAQALRDDTQRRGDEKIQVAQREKDKLNQTVNKLKLLEDSINNYLNNGGPGKLAACDRAIKALDHDLERLESERLDVTTKNNEVKALINDGENIKRSIKDNLQYRKSLADLEGIQEEIRELESRNSVDDYNRLHKEANALDNKRIKLNSDRDRLYTQMSSENQQLEYDIKEWELEYAGAATKWREDNIKVQTTRAAVEDLTKCNKALDKAIIQFHALKMEEVNSIAGELWRSTYQGTDVDTIMIKSEDDEGTANRKAYNYRVVMVKQDAELDMRGRCSAGQKVLASIIIRLALAESFGVSCGVIALDEPTTNLDVDNIKALAISLNQIIKNRKHQKNFQLVIITHDETFIKEMKCRDFTDEYWRVYRNGEQNSEIKKQDLALIDDD
ncbi:related to RAD50 homolog uvs-6 [Phialocephala subalpina]|uniref:DNA repair protein RAD50 n=1 Tax=Phialocephala subalpina TaxID=576137 RepID=A0A1L7WRF1_9HELO|nr:related to RAD50 homolog uvs-6 [Phialocephala subalpina]